MDLLTHLLHYFFIVLPSFFIIPLCLYPLFYPLSLSSRFFLCHEWWSSTFQCMEDGHVPFHFYLMDIGSAILSWEGYLVKESSCTSLFEGISILLCILKGTHLLIFRVCTGKRKKKEKENVRMYTMFFFIEYVYWPLKVPFFLVCCLWEFICELSRDSHLLVSILCILLARDKWPFPRDSGSLSSPSLHTLVIWLFSMTWFEWISAHSFSFDHLFISWYFIHLAYIVLCSYRFTFPVRYFPHIILIHPISSSIFFISSLSSLIY